MYSTTRKTNKTSRRTLLKVLLSNCVILTGQTCCASICENHIVLNKYNPDRGQAPLLTMKIGNGELTFVLDIADCRSHVDKKKFAQLMPGFGMPEKTNDIEYFSKAILQTDFGEIALEPLVLDDFQMFGGKPSPVDGTLALSALWDHTFCFDGVEFSLTESFDYEGYDEIFSFNSSYPRSNIFDVDIFGDGSTACAFDSTKRFGVSLASKVFDRAIKEGLIAGVSAVEIDAPGGKNKIRTGILKRISLFGRDFFEQIISESHSEFNSIGLQLMTRFKFALRLSRGAIAVTYIDPPYERK